ncbi:stage II sporulation protein D [Bacillaceae bacterium Marseille-Q3522]|nr:stage II sporulation protein D [Bacillaceae bacterium Marseille-Q3522]
MKTIKPFAVVVTFLIIIILLVPALLVLPFSQEKASGRLEEDLQTENGAVNTVSTEAAIEVAVYRTNRQELETPQLEEYLIGVVASEMPADFEKEALKAQALTARTYIVKQLENPNSAQLPNGAIVDDTEKYQVYKNRQELEAQFRKKWGADYQEKLSKVTEAVRETSGQILTFENKPIEATFFSTSNGYTESSEAIWPNAIPYLTAVESPWDLKSPKFSGQKVISVDEFEEKLSVKLDNSGTIGKITEKTAGKRIAKVDINGKTVTGKEIREKLKLKSTDFTWERKGNNIVINTKGFGHGVGMSQYGANGMAQEGKSYQDIVKYYYKGIEITTIDKVLTKMAANQ